MEMTSTCKSPNNPNKDHCFCAKEDECCFCGTECQVVGPASAINDYYNKLFYKPSKRQKKYVTQQVYLTKNAWVQARKDKPEPESTGRVGDIQRPTYIPWQPAPPQYVPSSSWNDNTAFTYTVNGQQVQYVPVRFQQVQYVPFTFNGIDTGLKVEAKEPLPCTDDGSLENVD